jgi:hypothetical protein
VASAAKAAVRWLAGAVLVAADITAPEIVAALEISELLAEAALPYIQAYFDPPQSLADLTRRRTIRKQDTIFTTSSNRRRRRRMAARTI